MSFGLGFKVIRRLCVEQSPLAWYNAKLRPLLFKPYELPLYHWIQEFVQHHHVLPQLETIETHFPDVAQIETPEPASYYLQLLENQYCYERINKANLDAQQILKQDQNAHEAALEVLRQCTRDITAQKYRLRVLDVPKEAATLVMAAYHHTSQDDFFVEFGWPYIDLQCNGVMRGEVVSFVGRPATGKTWLTLWSALTNWRAQRNVLFVSMEMMVLPIAQRITALYTHQNIQQLKMSGYSDTTLKKFISGLKCLTMEQGKFYVIDGNLAASADDIFSIAEILNCSLVLIDGAYLLRHKNLRLDRYTRAAENVELIKRYCTDLGMTAFCSWQFNREATKKQKKGNSGDLEDIGYSDAIAQISSIALGLFQEEGIETMKARTVRVLKGRNGEVGQFSINWNFNTMQFDEVDAVTIHEQQEIADLQWV